MTAPVIESGAGPGTGLRTGPEEAAAGGGAETLARLVTDALGGRGLHLEPADRTRMRAGAEALERRLAAGSEVYGVTRGFGPLVTHPAAADRAAQGLGLIHHLCTGQGPALSPGATALMVWLRLRSMRHGYSGVAAETWQHLADLHARGFVPVVPSEGSLSASGDLVPLAHAALAFGGGAEAWHDGRPAPADEVLAGLGLAPVRWDARSALAFVNGTSAALAVAVLDHRELLAQTRAVTALTARIVRRLGCSPEPYSEPLNRVRNQPGQQRAAAWIRAELGPGHRRRAERPLQEPYSLRCVPQVAGAVLDQLDAQGRILLAEAAGCTDNPVVVDGDVWHGGNFHAAPVGLAADQLTLCAHQLALLAERQLALLLDPAHNGGRPPMLTPTPGATSGLAGVQIAASSFVARMRQLGYPATLTPIPTNLGNQDHVPMALNGATAGAEAIRLGWLVIGSLALAVHQLERLSGDPEPQEPLWAELRQCLPALEADVPLAGAVREAAGRLRAHLLPPGPDGRADATPWVRSGPGLL